MSLRNTTTQWGSLSKTFHWLIVILLIVQGVLGLVMGDYPRETRMELVTLHKSIGVTILLLAAARLAWVLYNGRPGPAPGVTPLQYKLSLMMDGLLYLLLFAVPITGWLMVSYGGRPVEWFGLFQLPALVGENQGLHETFEEVHESLFWALTLLATGHAGMAIYHQIFQRDGTLSRMLPKGWLRDPSQSDD